ncbi:MAG: hypothetical protein ACK4GL_08815 [Flavobacteriales bacterium]
MLRIFAFFYFLSGAIGPVFGQLANTRLADGSMLIQVQLQGVSIRDKFAFYPPHQQHGPYFTPGFELQRYDYKFLGLRQRLNLDLASESLYILILMAIKGDWKDPDGRYSNTSYFNTGLFEYVPIIPLFTTNSLSLGAGGALYDLNYTHYLYDANGMPANPEKSNVSQYGFYGGWSVFADILLTQKFTLHNDFYYGYNFFNGAQDKLKKAGERPNPFRSWKFTTNLFHESGLFVSLRYHQFVNLTAIPTQASRFTFGVGYRFGMD